MTNERVVLAALLTLFVCRAAMANMLVPPWQGPDENAHFALAYGLTIPLRMTQDSVEAEVIRSEVRYRWFDVYDDVPPDPLPTTFPGLGISRGRRLQPLYYYLGAGALKVSGATDVETAYYHLRFLSVVLGIVTLVLAWGGTRLLFGPEIAVGTTAIAALHPQFLLSAISVNPDALLNVFGAFVWWQTARVVTGSRRGLSLVLLLAGAIAALLTKLIGMLLVAVAVVITAVSLAVNPVRIAWKRVVMAGIGCSLGVAAILVVVARIFEEQLQLLPGILREPLTVSRPLAQATLPEAFKFVRLTIDYSWLIGGWLRFSPPEPWLWVARVLVLGGLTGAAVVLIESRALRPRLSIAWLFVVTQTVGMLGVVFWTIRAAPQSRYLFPVFAPITVLLYIGLQRLVPRAWQRYWPMVLVVILVTLDVTGFATVHIPAYVR